MPWATGLIVTAAAALLAGCSAGAPTRPADPADQGQAVEAVDREAGRDTAAGDAVPDAALRAYESALDAMRSDDWTEAELQLEQLMLAYPALPGPYVNAAIVYRRDGRNEDALAAVETALAIDPSHPEANNQLGILLREKGDFSAAEAAYRRAIESHPDYMLASYNLGVLLDLYLHRQGEALVYYEQYQRSLAEPDETVARWIIDLRRRVGADDDGAARVAQGERP